MALKFANIGEDPLIDGEAKWRKGLYAKHHIVCNLTNQIETINFLSEEFGIDLEAPIV